MSAYENAALLALVKKQLRLTAATMDDEVKDLIAAAIDDMKMRGVDADALCPAAAAAVSDMNPLAVRAVVYYCKTNFGIAISPDENERYWERYEGLTQSMSLAKGYRQTAAEGGV